MAIQDKSVFNSRILPLHIYQMLSEILQEHQEKTVKHDYKWLKPSGEVSELRQYVKCFKNDEGNEAQIGVFNVLQIIDYYSNGDLTEEDFSELDLRMCSLAGKNTNKSNFTNAYINENVFFFLWVTQML